MALAHATLPSTSRFVPRQNAAAPAASCRLGRSVGQQQAAFRTIHTTGRGVARRNLRIAAAEGEAAEEDDFEAKLKALKTNKGFGAATPAKAAKAAKAAVQEGGAAPSVPFDESNFADEELFWEGKPANGDLAFNIVAGATLLWLPLTFAAIGRYAYQKYKFTSKRIVVESTSPFDTSTLNVSYDKVTSCITVGRLVGLWGDMILTLTDGTKIEIRSLARHKEFEKYVKDRMPQEEEVVEF